MADELAGHETDLEYIRQLYANAISYLGETIDELIRSVSGSTNRDIVFIISADHGENLGYSSDNRLFGHEGSLSEGLLHIPFDIISSTHNGETTDLMTLCSLGDIVHAIRTDEPVTVDTEQPVVAEIAGHSDDLLTEDAGYLLTEDAGYLDRARRAIYNGEMKSAVDETGETTVYDVSGAPNTQTELHEPDTVPADPFDQSVAEFADQSHSSGRSVELDTTVEQRLDRLGYQ